MSRIARARRLQSLQVPLTTPSSPSRTPFSSASAIRAVSTTPASRSKNTEWIRSKLWKGEAPGPEDPYTQRAEPEEPASHLPDEAQQQHHEQYLVDRRPEGVRNTRLTMPPKRTEAATEAELKTADPSYVPAADMSELEDVATPQDWWDQPGHWGAESRFRGFGGAEKVTDRALVEVHLRRAVVEVLALKQSGEFAAWAARRWRAGGQDEMDRALTVGIEMEDGGMVKLTGDGVSDVVGSVIVEAEEAETAVVPSVEEAKEMIKTWDPAWKTLVLDDQIKFALRKRLYQLTGTLIPDSQLGAATTVSHILRLATKPDKPAKLADVLATRTALPSLPNVALHARKVGAIDKERAVGRWKVIEEELRQRGLPVTGTGDLPRNKEKEWLRGIA